MARFDQRFPDDVRARTGPVDLVGRCGSTETTAEGSVDTLINDQAVY